MNDSPISFYVPARNAARTLGPCVESILAQTRRPDELFILADPRSSDETLAVARQTGIRVLEQTGATLGAARNQALLAAVHPWVASCDADVVLERDWLACLAARRRDGAAGIGGRTLERTRNPFDEWRAMHMPHHWGEHPLRNPFMLVSEVLFARDALLAVGGYRDDLNYHEDSDLCQRLRDGGYALDYEPGAVAVHQRSDTLLGLLNLRWKYSEHRQKHLLERYAGLQTKLHINREYTLGTMARCLARGREDLTYISFLLYLHHLLMDHGALLARRPLLADSARGQLQQQLLDAGLDVVRGFQPALAVLAEEDLRPVAPFTPHVPADGLPTWGAHLAAVREATRRLCQELTPSVLDLTAASGAYCHGRLSLSAVPGCEPPCRADLWEQLETMGLTECVDAGLMEALQKQWPDSTSLLVLGRLGEHELKLVRKTTRHARSGAASIALMAHLESRAEPLAFFSEVSAKLSRLAVCYRPPARFIPGLDVPAPGDLACAAASAGWTIERFETLVGRVQLLLSRASGGTASQPDQTRPAATSAHRPL